MLDTHLLLAFTLAASVAMIVPGPDMLFVLGCGMRGGPRAGLLATAGVATSEAVHVAVAAAGLAALFAAAPTLYAVLRGAGGVYLVWLGIRLIRQRAAETGGAAGVSGRRAYLNGLTTNLLNPKMVTFSVAFLPQFVDPARGHVGLQFAALGVLLIVLEFLVDGTVGVFAGRIGDGLRRRRTLRRRVDVATGGIFIGLGLRLAADR